MTGTDAARGHTESAVHARRAPGITVGGEYLHLPENGRFVKSQFAPGRPAVFLDRDGVLLEDVHFLRNATQVNILPGVVGALRVLREQYYIIVVTNQSGVARGLLTEDDLLGIHSRLVRGLAEADAALDAIYYCPHLAEAVMPEYRMECRCRKPGPGMLLRAGSDWRIDLAGSLIVGDKPRDIEAGLAAGVRGILLGDAEVALPDLYGTAPDLSGAARLILASHGTG